MSHDKEQRIRLRAYHIWERGGRGEGRAEDHWRQAEIEVERELAQPSGQGFASQGQPKRKAGPRGEPPADRTAQARAGADMSGKAEGKPVSSRGRKPPGAKPTGAAQTSDAARKPAAVRPRRTPPT